MSVVRWGTTYPPAVPLLAVLVSAASCGGPTLPEGRYSCEPGQPGACPPGWFCRGDHRCWSTPGDAGDGDVLDDGGEEGLADGDGDGEAGCNPATCDDGNVCNGEEVCTVEGRCVATVPPDEGTDCTTRGVAGRCFVEQCRPVTCGDGVIDEGEDCDDLNFVGGDGCEPDCTFTCEYNRECDDGEACDGEEICRDHRCLAGTMQADGTPCGPPGEPLVCIGAACVASRCGDGFADAARGEECDDGNAVDGDGCDVDCAWSCESAADCDDLQLCDGSETCDAAAHVCRPGVRAADGTSCTRAAGGDGVCRSGECVGLLCGNGTVDADEECDDGNPAGGDGCEIDCTWTCETALECDDRGVCDGAETCDAGAHLCIPGTAASDGTACDGDGDPSTRDICLAAACGPSICGDGWVDEPAGERCDDGNAVPGDGCEAGCDWSCTADADCDDAEMCSGVETCDPAGHRCLPGTPLADGTGCTAVGGTPGHCRRGACARLTCGNGLADAGEECDDGNTVNGDGCDAACVYSCHGSRECVEAPDDPCTTDVCEPGGAGQLCRHVPNTAACDDADPCTDGDRCAGDGLCRGTLVDADGDTFGPGDACGLDCDDADRTVYPDAPESCNGIDDDCSGTADDGSGMTCARGSSRSCVADGPGGTCVGTEACLAADCTWSGLCEPSAVETCNGADDDCNGETDETFPCVLGTTADCTTSCGLTGVRICGAGCVPGPCWLFEAPCNRCDDDLDGVTDEGAWCPPAVAPTTVNLFAVGGSAADDVWVVGAAGTILHWDGSAWSPMSGGGTAALNGVWAASRTDAWAVGNAGAIRRWDGASWTDDRLASVTANLLAVWGALADDVWAVAGDATIIHRTDAAWESVPSGTTRALNGVGGVAGGPVWAAGNRGIIQLWDGSAWTATTTDSTRNLLGVGASSPAAAWVVGDGGTILRWDGERWNAEPSGTTAQLHGVWSGSAADAWAVGNAGTIRHWNGTSWADSASGSTRALNGVWGASAADVWVVGAAGTILHGRW
jgi:cysteine-rich repeat protein